MMIIAINLSLLLICLFPSFSAGFWLDTHKKITDTAIGTANLSSTIDDQTGITNTLKMKVTVGSQIKPLEEWIRFGSEEEDNTLGIPPARYLNHFYNPLNGTGLNDPIALVNGLPSYAWASHDANEWSWKVARNQYLLGLTSSTDTARKTALANSFRAIGQVMHLVEDLAVPAHVRNDAHPIGDGFETYANKHLSALNFYYYYPFASALSSVSQYAPKQFWDSDSYDGSNPSARNTQGLAEYTNANFFSGDTVANGSFPYPKIYSDTTIDFRNITNPNTGHIYPRMYYSKKYDGETNNGQGYLLSTVAFLDDWRARVIPIATPDQPFFPVLDDNVYKDYASLLIPRAVGYSSGLLNYFFRGEIDLKPDSANRDKFVILNKGSELMFGTFSLYYDYDEGDAKDNRKFIASWYKTISAGGQSEPVTFPMPSSPAPKEKCKFILVFQGTIGNEVGAVVGKKVTFCEGSTGTITGPDKVFTDKNTSYSLNWPDAIGNITWSTNNPSANIWGDNNGATLWAASGACSSNKGAIKITATDICGNKTELTVQTGTWVLVSSQGVKCSYACETINGSLKTEYWWKACCDINSNNGAGCKAECGGDPIGGLPPCGDVQTGTCPLPCGTNCSWCYNTFGVFNYEWKCQ